MSGDSISPASDVVSPRSTLIDERARTAVLRQRLEVLAAVLRHRAMAGALVGIATDPIVIANLDTIEEALGERLAGVAAGREAQVLPVSETCFGLAGEAEVEIDAAQLVFEGSRALYRELHAALGSSREVWQRIDAAARVKADQVNRLPTLAGRLAVATIDYGARLDYDTCEWSRDVSLESVAPGPGGGAPFIQPRSFVLWHATEPRAVRRKAWVAPLPSGS